MTIRIERFAPILLFVVLVIALVLRLWSIDFGLTNLGVGYLSDLGR